MEPLFWWDFLKPFLSRRISGRSSEGPPLRAFRELDPKPKQTSHEPLEDKEEVAIDLGPSPGTPSPDTALLETLIHLKAKPYPTTTIDVIEGEDSDHSLAELALDYEPTPSAKSSHEQVDVEEKMALIERPEKEIALRVQLVCSKREEPCRPFGPRYTFVKRGQKMVKIKVKEPVVVTKKRLERLGQQKEESRVSNFSHDQVTSQSKDDVCDRPSHTRNSSECIFNDKDFTQVREEMEDPFPDLDVGALIPESISSGLEVTPKDELNVCSFCYKTIIGDPWQHDCFKKRLEQASVRKPASSSHQVNSAVKPSPIKRNRSGDSTLSMPSFEGRTRVEKRAKSEDLSSGQPHLPAPAAETIHTLSPPPPPPSIRLPLTFPVKLCGFCEEDVEDLADVMSHPCYQQRIQPQKRASTQRSRAASPRKVDITPIAYRPEFIRHMLSVQLSVPKLALNIRQLEEAEAVLNAAGLTPKVNI